MLLLRGAFELKLPVVYPRKLCKAVVETMVKEGYANSQSEAIRMAIMDFGQHHLGETDLVNEKLDKIDSEIAKGKRKLLNSKDALGEYAKYVKWFLFTNISMMKIGLFTSIN